jgi:hypothetical protein
MEKIEKIEVNNGEVFIAEVIQFGQQETEFYEPDLEPLRSSFFINPAVANRLVDALRQNGLLVVGGRPDIDKSVLARYIALLASNPSIQNDSSSYKGKMVTLEWDRSSSDLQSVETKLRKTEAPTIFILPKVSPQDVRYDLLSLKNIADIHKHLILISTDLPFQSWNLPTEDQHFLKELPEDIYRSEDLIGSLKHELIKSKEFLNEELWIDYSKSDYTLIGGIPIRDIANDLKTTDNIFRFISLLQEEEPPLKPEVIKNLIDDANNKMRTIERWYPALSSREQLLALGLSFFDGLFDDQFFAAIDRVVERVWQRRDSSLRALDYCDLDRLRNFFDFVSTKDYGIKIESNFPDQRRMIFEVAWNSHRRQILTALPVIAQLVIDSVESRSRDPELYGTIARRDQLRMVISEALSDLGLISVISIQRTLIQLAADKNMGVQAVAARAMAQWRQHGRENQLFGLLDMWIENPQNYLRATVALAVSYAARYDPPNGLNFRLCKLLQVLARDQDPLVRNNFCIHTLRYVIPRHLIQLQKMLHDMTEYMDLIPEIAKSLALAYRYNDVDVLDILKLWHQECRSLRSAYINSTQINLREKLLSTIILTYGLINYNEGHGALTADDAFKLMKNILAEERHPFIHKSVVIAVSHLASVNFDNIEPSLKKLVVEIDERESDEIIQILTDIYLKQRSNLKSSNDFLELNGTQYPIWIDSERPQTSVENAMYRWIKDPNYPEAQQVALRALVAFSSAFDQLESEKISQIREQRKLKIEKPQPKMDSLIMSGKLVKENKSIEKFMILLATLSANCYSYKAVIQGLLPEVLAQNKSNKQTMALIQKKWYASSDNELQTIAMLQERAIWLIDRDIYVIGVIILGLLALLWIMAKSSFLLFVIIIGVLILAWYRLRYIPAQKKQGIENISLKQMALQFKNKLNK